MILDKMCNIRYYEYLLPNLDNGLKCIESIKEYTPGRLDFEGGFLLIQKGTTQGFEGGLYEAHKDYIDVQILVEGSEEIAWGYLEDLTVKTPYQPDAMFLEGDLNHVVTVLPGMFYAAFPSDGHMPCRHTDNAREYTKLVLKLKIPK